MNAISGTEKTKAAVDTASVVAGQKADFQSGRAITGRQGPGCQRSVRRGSRASRRGLRASPRARGRRVLAAPGPRPRSTASSRPPARCETTWLERTSTAPYRGDREQLEGIDSGTPAARMTTAAAATTTTTGAVADQALPATARRPLRPRALPGHTGERPRSSTGANREDEGRNDGRVGIQAVADRPEQAGPRGRRRRGERTIREDTGADDRAIVAGERTWRLRGSRDAGILGRGPRPGDAVSRLVGSSAVRGPDPEDLELGSLEREHLVEGCATASKARSSGRSTTTALSGGARRRDSNPGAERSPRREAAISRRVSARCASE